MKGIKALRKKVASVFGPITEKAHAAWKEATGQRKLADEPLAEAEAIIKRSMGAWTSEQQRIAREAARQREADLRRREEENRIAEAVALEADGEREQADEMIVEPVVVAPVVPARAVPKIAGISQRESWKARVVDVHALLKAAAADADGLAAGILKVDQVALNGLARSLKGALSIPGVKTYNETGIAASA